MILDTPTPLVHSGIYVVYETKNPSQRYIGKSTDLWKRYSYYRAGTFPSNVFTKPPSHYTFKVLKLCPPEQLDKFEAAIIARVNPTLNTTPGGCPTQWSPQQRAEVSEMARATARSRFLEKVPQEQRATYLERWARQDLFREQGVTAFSPKYELCGIEKTAAEWCALFDLKPVTFHSRRQRGWPMDQILTAADGRGFKGKVTLDPKRVAILKNLLGEE